ncbi:MAG: hypothetical protein O9262_02270, partial [Cyclobacteriaceae bacterium]|nr:hypothetical protein [Cyclobacteriaceae bacterium]
MSISLSKIFVNLLIVHLLLLSTLVHAQDRKRVKTTTIFEINIEPDSKTDTLTKKITLFSFDSTIIDQTVITSGSEFFGFPIDHRDSIVLKDKRPVFHLTYGNKNQPLYVAYSSYQFNKYNQVIEQTDSVYNCDQLANDSETILKESLYGIRKTTYQYNKLKQNIREITQSDMIEEPSLIDMRYWYNQRGQLKKRLTKDIEKEV